MFLLVFFLACFIFAFTDARTTQDYPIPGAPVPITNATELKELVRYVVRTYNRESNDAFYYVSVGVIEATEQLVAGTNYDITLKMGKTNCFNDQASVSGSKLCKVEDTNITRKVRAHAYQRLGEDISKTAWTFTK